MTRLERAILYFMVGYVLGITIAIYHIVRSVTVK